MDAAIVFRVISLIPDRMPRMQSGCVFNPGSQPEQLVLLAKFLTWLAPLDPISKEEQQLLGVRSAAGRPLGVGEEEGELESLEPLEPLESLEPLEPLEPLEALEETSATVPGAGTQIAA